MITPHGRFASAACAAIRLRIPRQTAARWAHDELIAAAYRAQANALEIESRAKARLADEYDAAQERGEVQKHGRVLDVPDGNIKPATAEDIFGPGGRKQIHEARQVRDAEEADPGIVKRTLDERVDSGQEPSKAHLREVLLEAARSGGGSDAGRQG